jgi:NarL family two-component system response regulator LiaR
LWTSAPTAYRDPHQGEERCRYQRSTVDPNPIRVLVVDDHFVVRTGVRALLHGAADITVAGEAENGLEAVAEARRLEPQVILMDLMLPLLDGVEAIRAILAAQPDTGIIVLTGSDADALVLAAVEAGALGYLAKSAGREDFLAAIRRVALGEPWLPHPLTRKLLAHLKPAPGGSPEALTERETAVLRLLARGSTNQQIAAELNVAPVTVRTHVSHILGKLGARNRVEAVLHALRSGAASLEEV